MQARVATAIVGLSTCLTRQSAAALKQQTSSIFRAFWHYRKSLSHGHRRKLGVLVGLDAKSHEGRSVAYVARVRTSNLFRTRLKTTRMKWLVSGEELTLELKSASQTRPDVDKFCE